VDVRYSRYEEGGCRCHPVQQRSRVRYPTFHHSVSTDHVSFWRRMLAFGGPAYLVSVGYMDPGNWATDLQGGAEFGYTLLWVLVMSNAMAVLLQTLGAAAWDRYRPGPRAGVP